MCVCVCVYVQMLWAASTQVGCSSATDGAHGHTTLQRSTIMHTHIHTHTKIARMRYTTAPQSHSAVRICRQPLENKRTRINQHTAQPMQQMYREHAE